MNLGSKIMKGFGKGRYFHGGESKTRIHKETIITCEAILEYKGGRILTECKM